MTQSAIVVGAGPGLGAAVARAFAADGFRVAVVARDTGRLEALAATDPARLVPYACDATDPDAVAAVFGRTERELGPIACAVFNAGAYRPGGILDITPEAFEQCWRVGAFAGFLVGQAAARAMLPRGAGTILFTGATASVRGGRGFANLASPKFALRALAQSMARELGPQGIHVAHVIVDGQIGPPRAGVPQTAAESDTTLDPDAIAALYLHLHRQPRSVWTHEADLRPWVERF